MTAENRRLDENYNRTKNWKRWGPFLSERQWGTVREDYSEQGNAWSDFPHDHARSRAYRWGEDGLLGWTDRQCRLCFSVALWNGRDPILKERLYGLTGPEGNHGEDVKECYYYLDSTPTHSYAKAVYRYPHAEYPYQQLQKENQHRGLNDPEFEIADTGVFDENRFFDVQVEYAKKDDNDILIRITATNHGPEEADLWVLPTLWFRNTWVWECKHEGCSLKPRLQLEGTSRVKTTHETLPDFNCDFGEHPDQRDRPLLFTENETNFESLYHKPNSSAYVKDAFHRWVIDNETEAVNPAQMGTKAAAVYHLSIPAGESQVITVRLTQQDQQVEESLGSDFDQTFTQRIAEADEYYESIIPQDVDAEQRMISRQAYAGLLWSKQFYHYIVKEWLEGDDEIAPPSEQRKKGRNHQWEHLYARDVISMPDKWEYPWFAAWDLAFHMIPMARIDAQFAKKQLLLLLREWYMHPNGQLPAYEYAFYDVNPPVHAWACLRVYRITGSEGNRDHKFLARAFQRLLLNFTWWVNRIDDNGDNIFAGGFLGLDNIGVFDRTKGLPEGAKLEQADGTSWMAFYCSTMLSIALELAQKDAAYAEMASKFLDHYVRISEAMNSMDGTGLWDQTDQFYFDHLHVDGESHPLKVRSLVGLLPLIAVETFDGDLINQFPDFRRKLDWFLKYRHDLVNHINFAQCDDGKLRMLLSIPSEERLKRVVSVMLDETEFLSPYGIRSLSKMHETHPFELSIRGKHHQVSYNPGESDSWMFGGNSNWRGPVWFPINYLLIESLQEYHKFYGDSFQVECPTGSGNWMNLDQASKEIARRLVRL